MRALYGANVMATLDPTLVTFFDSIYPGTVCTGSFVQQFPLRRPGDVLSSDPSPSSGGVDPSGSFGTSPFSACPPGMGGCVTAMTIFSNTIDVGVNHYTAEVILSLDSYDGATGSWAAQATAFYNNHGQSWGMAISGVTVNYSDHRSFWHDAFGRGDWVWGSLNPFDMGLALVSERVHMGSQALLTITWPDGRTASQSYCFFAEYNVQANPVNGGWCANP